MQDVFQSIKSIPTVEIAQRYIAGLQLYKKGDRYTGLCPFHEEKTPSFTIFENGRFRCFGCGASGDGVDLVAQAMNIPLKEAAFLIAKNYGLHFDKPDSPKVKKRLEDINRDRELMNQFRLWRQRTFKGLSLVSRSCNRILADGPENPGYEAATKLKAYTEFLLDVMEGSAAEQVALFNEFGWSWSI